MGNQSKTLNGGRAQLWMSNPANDTLQLVGIFNSCNLSIEYDVAPIYILGRFGPAELCYTGVGPATVTLSGFRVVGDGPFQIGNAPTLQSILTAQDFQLVIVDRENPHSDPVATVTGCRVTGFSMSGSSRSVYDLSINVQGLALEDESGPQNEPNATPYG